MEEYNPMNYDCQPVEEPQQTPPYEAYQNSDTGSAPKKPKKNHTGLKIAALVAVVALLGSIGGVLLTGAIGRIHARSEAASMRQEVEDAQQPEAGTAGSETEAPDEETGSYELVVHDLPDTLSSNDAGKSLTPAQVYELTVNSVVGIRTEATINVFGQVAVSASAGSGFVLTEDGYVITNAHVVSGAETIHVDLYNGESYDAKLVGADSDFDIAVLKVEAEGLTPVSVGNSDELKVGEEVVAIGNPLGELTFTMTNGILSALDREINTDGTPQNMIQTNAAINSGNSGGPLFDMDGNVIGVTTAKYSGSSSSGTTIEGLGFAIPVNTALKVAYDLAEHGYVRGQAYLGITVSTLDAQTAKYYSLPVGPRVESVAEGSCAEAAGLQVGDIIIRFNGVETTTHPELLAALKKVQAGDTVDMTIFRAGAELELSVTLDERPPQEVLDAATQEAQEQKKQNQEEAPKMEPVPVEPQEGDDSFYYYFHKDPFGFGN